jgi:hypothetical protein
MSSKYLLKFSESSVLKMVDFDILCKSYFRNLKFINQELRFHKKCDLIKLRKIEKIIAQNIIFKK